MAHEEEEVSKALTLIGAQWCADLEAELSKIVTFPVNAAAIKEGLQAGTLSALWIMHNGARIGALVWSVEDLRKERAVIINALSCQPLPGICMTETILTCGAQIGAQVGAQVVRAWTQRAGLARKIEKLGGTVHFVLEKEIG